MPRTTLNIDAPILRDLKKLQKAQRKALGRIVSDLLAQALDRRQARRNERPRFGWNAAPLGLRVDLTDKDAVWSLLDRNRDAADPEARA